MPLLQISNNAKSTLVADISDVATTLNVVSITNFPTSGDFLVTVWNANSYKDPGDDSSMEIMKVTAVSGTAFTIERAQESTSAIAHTSGNAVQMLFTAGILQETRDAIPVNINDLEDVDFSSGTPEDNNVMTYDTATGKWKAESAQGGGGGTAAWEIDVNGGLMPVTAGFTDDNWELDSNSDLQPKSA